MQSVERMHHGRPPSARLDGSRVCCYTCGAQGTWDPVAPIERRMTAILADRAAWPQLPCVFTPDCPGATVPEVLN